MPSALCFNSAIADDIFSCTLLYVTRAFRSCRPRLNGATFDESQIGYSDDSVPDKVKVICYTRELFRPRPLFTFSPTSVADLHSAMSGNDLKRYLSTIAAWQFATAILGGALLTIQLAIVFSCFSNFLQLPVESRKGRRRFIFISVVCRKNQTGLKRSATF
ncbi:hypothetical protein BKA70DRAFT_170222 [Coprinopsis sp. MPI-PUGE-AT-0042]|nr:hypothetical protein BKA70DRAFT_170222 [Coprinopsis sp. MPI-PUGE-AT-0042]